MEQALRQPQPWRRTLWRRVGQRDRWLGAKLVLGASAIALTGLAAAFWLRLPVIGLIWPAPVTNGTFLAAIAASIAAPVLLIVATGDFSGVRAGAVTLGAIYAGFVVASLPPLLQGNQAFAPFAVVSAIAVVGNAAMFRWACQFEDRDQRTPPAPVLWLCAIAAILLVIPGVAALLGVDFMPSPQPIETLRLSGAIYAGAGAFFLWVIARPTWSNARLVLLAFLVYDLLRFAVLPQVLPRLLADPAAVRVAAWIYWLAVGGSAIIACFYLLLAPAWRLWSPAGGQPSPVGPSGRGRGE